MMKKLVAILLCVLLCCSYLGYAAEDYDPEAEQYHESVGILKAIGVLDIESISEYDVFDVISRGEFVNQLMKVINTENISDSQQFFLDISGSPYVDSINAACHLGIVSQPDDWKFRPDDTITFDDAVTLVTRALGYNNIAISFGGYPSGYYVAANNIELLNGMGGVPGKEGISRGDASKLFLNALKAEPMKLKQIINGEDVYSSEEDSTLFWQTRKICFDTGKITATPYTRLATASGVGKGKLEINNILFDTDDESDYTDMLGSKVKYYYIDDEVSPKLLYIEEYKNNNNLIINAEDSVRIEDSILYYDVGDTNVISKATLSPSICVIYNGKATSDFIIPEYGQIKLIENGDTNGFDIAIITDYKDYVVSSVDIEEKEIRDLYDNSRILSFDDSDIDYLSVKDEDGLDVDIQTISKWDVISAATSLDGTIIKAVVVSKKIDGNVLSKYNNDSSGYSEVQIGEKVYKTTKEPKLLNQLSVGTEGIFYLNYFNRIAAVQVNGQTKKYGYLIAAAMAPGIEGTVNVKMLTIDDGVEVYDLSKKLKIDDDKAETGKIPKALCEGGAFKPQLVKYKLNEDYEVTEIETANKNTHYSKTGLRALTAKSSMRYYSATTTLAGRFMLNPSTIVFVVANDITNAKDTDFAIRGSSYFKSQTSYIVQPFVSTANAAIAEAVVVEQPIKPQIESSTPILCVSDTSQVINGEGDTVWKINGYNQIGEKTSIVTNDISVFNAAESNAGDMIKYVQNLSGEVTNIIKLYDTKTKVMNTAYANQSDYGNALRVISGRTISKNDNLIGLSLSTDSITDDTLIDEYIPTEKSVILVCDPDNKREKLRVGTISDIHDYRSYDSQYSTIVSCLLTTVPELVIVYK